MLIKNKEETLNQPLTERWNEDGSYSLLLYGKEIARGEYESVAKGFELFCNIAGSAVGIGLGIGASMLAVSVNPLFFLLIPAEELVLLRLILKNRSRDKKKEKKND